MLSKTRFRVALAIGVIGAITAFAMFIDNYSPSEFEILFVCLSSAGAGFAGYMSAGLIGQPGAKGWMLALLGACLSTIFGAMITGTAIMPVIGTFFGPVIVMIALFTHLTILLVWAGSMAVIHFTIVKSNT